MSGEIDITINSASWHKVNDIKSIVTSTCCHVMDFMSITDYVPAYDLSVVLTDDKEVQMLNKQFRNKDKPTNVLSFPMCDLLPDDLSALSNESPLASLGDIILAHETILREAEEQNKSMESHLKHLLVHGCLHILGHDHIEDDEAEVMETLEIKILERLGVENPY